MTLPDRRRSPVACSTVSPRDRRLPGGPTGLTALAADGRTVRDAKDADGTQVRLLVLLAAMTHRTGPVLAKTDATAKANEIPMLPVLLDGLQVRAPPRADRGSGHRYRDRSLVSKGEEN